MFNRLLLLVLCYTNLISATHLAIPKSAGSHFTIIGGNDTDISQYPFMVSIQEEGKLLCGGFLIFDRWVVTAARCVGDKNSTTIKSLTVRANSTVYTSGGSLLQVVYGIQHPQFDYEVDNDIALLYLNTSIDIAKFAILSESDEEISTGTLINATGWGEYNFDNEDNSVQLQNVEVPIVNSDICIELYEPVSINITDNVFCAGLVESGGKDFCTGDQGGPATIGDRVVGVISTGAGCAQPDAPGIYVKVSKYINWIQDVTGKK